MEMLAGESLTSWRAVASELMSVPLRLPVGVKLAFFWAPSPALSPCLAMSMTSATVRVRTNAATWSHRFAVPCKRAAAPLRRSSSWVQTPPVPAGMASSVGLSSQVSRAHQISDVAGYACRPSQPSTLSRAWSPPARRTAGGPPGGPLACGQVDGARALIHHAAPIIAGRGSAAHVL